MAQQLLVDLYGCDRGTLDDAEAIRAIAHDAIGAIGSSVVTECFHKFEPIGVSYIAVISTSHFSVHTWPEYGYAAIDVFSCAKEVPEGITNFLYEAFGASGKSVSAVTRDIGDSQGESD